MLGQEIDGLYRHGSNAEKHPRRRGHVAFVALMVVAGVLALLTGLLVFAPLVVALPYAAFVSTRVKRRVQ